MDESINTVSSLRQVERDGAVKIIRAENAAAKVLFFGNSITRHGPSEAIGWHGDWGMAASSEDKDYVHRTLAMIEDKLGPCDVCIAQGAEWERHYHDGTTLQGTYSPAADFAADIAIIRIGENISGDDMKEHPLGGYFVEMVKYLSKKAKITVVTDMFWRHDEKNEAAKYAAGKCGAEFVSLSDLSDSDENMAVGLFAHEGVAHHPGDLGMERIADRIFTAIKPKLDILK